MCYLHPCAALRVAVAGPLFAGLATVVPIAVPLQAALPFLRADACHGGTFARKRGGSAGSHTHGIAVRAAPGCGARLSGGRRGGTPSFVPSSTDCPCRRSLPCRFGHGLLRVPRLVVRNPAVTDWNVSRVPPRKVALLNADLLRSHRGPWYGWRPDFRIDAERAAVTGTPPVRCCLWEL